MRMSLRSGLEVVAAVAALVVPGSALAHTVMMTPTPRDNNTAYKTAPCGTAARTPYCTSYDAGATINVKWKETVGHSGCFQWAISKAGDTNFTVLRQINDPDNGSGTVYPDTLKLPDGYTCKDCTLVVRQLMVGRTCVGGDAGNGNTTTAPFENDQATPGETYYSCADIRIGDPTPCESPSDAGPDAGVEEDASVTDEDAGAGAGGSSSGDAAPPSIYTPSGNRADDSADAGCSTTGGATSGVALAMAVSVLGLAVMRRRRSR